MTAQIPINHHFTPIFYLNAWADADGRVTRYSRPVDVAVTKPCAPSRTGSAAHLYTLRGVQPERRAALETEFFKPVDTKAAEAHRILLAGGLNKLTHDQRCDWARFMMSMTLRSPFSLGELDNLVGQTLRSTMQLRDDAEFNALRKPDDPETLYDWTLKYHPEAIENAHKSFLPAMIDHEGLGQHLINMIWATVDVASAPHMLLTSDRPFNWSLGWKEPNAALAFPLSPDLVFVATNGRPQMDTVMRRRARDVVRIVNEETARLAVDFVIGCDASQLTFVERRLRRRDQEPIPGPIGRGRPGCPA
jgi:hypothetical protein